MSDRGVFGSVTDVLVFASVLATFMSSGAGVLARLSVCLSVNISSVIQEQKGVLLYRLFFCSQLTDQQKWQKIVIPSGLQWRKVLSGEKINWSSDNLKLANCWVNLRKTSTTRQVWECESLFLVCLDQRGSLCSHSCWHKTQWQNVTASSARICVCFHGICCFELGRPLVVYETFRSVLWEPDVHVCLFF